MAWDGTIYAPIINGDGDERLFGIRPNGTRNIAAQVNSDPASTTVMRQLVVTGDGFNLVYLMGSAPLPTVSTELDFWLVY